MCKTLNLMWNGRLVEIPNDNPELRFALAQSARDPIAAFYSLLFFAEDAHDIACRKWVFMKKISCGKIWVSNNPDSRFCTMLMQKTGEEKYWLVELQRNREGKMRLLDGNMFPKKNILLEQLRAPPVCDAISYSASPASSVLSVASTISCHTVQPHSGIYGVMIC